MSLKAAADTPLRPPHVVRTPSALRPPPPTGCFVLREEAPAGQSNMWVVPRSSHLQRTISQSQHTHATNITATGTNTHTCARTHQFFVAPAPHPSAVYPRKAVAPQHGQGTKCRLNKQPTKTAKRMSGVRKPHTPHKDTFSLRRTQKPGRRHTGVRQKIKVLVSCVRRGVQASRFGRGGLGGPG